MHERARELESERVRELEREKELERLHTQKREGTEQAGVTHVHGGRKEVEEDPTAASQTSPAG